jgi:hypothetical protein
MKATRSTWSIGTPNRPMALLLVLTLTALLLGSSSSTLPTETSNQRSIPAKPDKAAIVESYGQLPISFEANQGQADAQAKFLARGQGYSLFLTSTEIVLALFKPTASQAGAEAIRPMESAMLRMSLSNANPAPQVVGLDELSGKVNYLIGNAQHKWQTHIPTYQRVKYKSIYPGIDVIFYGNQQQLEYDFVVAPGADPNAITLDLQGADKLELDTRGDLLLYLAGGQIRMHKPLVYQETNGIRQDISGNYLFKGNHQIGFQVAAYDPAKPLIIDPILSYSTYLGGDDVDVAWAIAVDSSGNAYVTGYTESSTFPTANALQMVHGGLLDVFVTKLDPSGSTLIYSTYLGGSGFDDAYGIAVDSAGSAYVTGGSKQGNFPTVNPLQPTNRGLTDVFILKLDPSGSALVYSTYLGGNSDDAGRDIAVDYDGNAYVAGQTYSTDFPTENAFRASYSGSGDAFFAKVDASGTALVYSTYLGGSGDDLAWRIAVNDYRDAYLTGITASTDFPTVNPLQPTFGGGRDDAFVVKFDGLANVVYATYLGGSANDRGFGIAADTSGAYVTGTTFSNDFPTMNPFQTVYQGGGGIGGDAFLAKFSPGGSTLLFSTYLGGGEGDAGRGVMVDGSGNVYITGDTQSTNFPIVSPLQATNAGGTDTFVAKFNPTGSRLVYSTYLGGRWSEGVTDGAVDASGDVYITGQTPSPDFPMNNPAQSGHGGGSSDAFVAKINPAGSGLVYSTYLDGDASGYGVTVDAEGNAYITGETESCSFQASFPFPPDECERLNVFVIKLNATGSAVIYATYLGGSSHDFGRDIAVDASGNAYVTGKTSSVDFPTANPAQPNYGGNGDAFVAKLDPNGSALIYSTYLGGNNDENTGDSWLGGVAVDENGNAYVTGQTYSTDFPTFNAIQPSLLDNGDAFVTKLSPVGSFVYSTYLGGGFYEAGYDIVVDSSGNAYITGVTASSDFPIMNALQPTRGSGAALKSIDSGSSWHSIEVGLNSAANTIAIDPIAPTTVYVGAYGVFKSTDAGESWTSVSTGLPNDAVFALAIDPTTPSTLYAGTGSSGVFKSVDGGATWVLASTGLTYVNINTVTIDPTDAATLYAGTYGGGIYKSTDGAISWTAMNNGLIHTHVFAFEVDPLTPTTLYAGTIGGVFKSTDGGGSWAPMNDGLTNSSIQALAIDPTTPMTLYAATHNLGIVKSTNGGVSWTVPATVLTSNTNKFALAIDPATPTTLYAGTADGIFKSTDGGNTWSPVGPRVSVLEMAIDPTTSSTIYVGSAPADEAFVTKLNATGTALIYSTYVGGGAGENGVAIAVDSNRNAYVTGNTSSADFPTMNPLQPSLRGGTDAFIAKVNISGSALVYATYLGGHLDPDGADAYEMSHDIAVDSSGNVYVTGETDAIDFPTANALQPAFGNYTDAFVTKLNPFGTALIASTYLGGSDSDAAYGLTVDRRGNIYLTGSSYSLDFPIVNPLQLDHSGGYSFLGDAFVAKLSNTPPGSNATVSPGSGTTMTFANVTSPGETTVTTSSTGPNLPSGFSLGSPPTHYEISTTATFTPPITICIEYDSSQYSDPDSLHLLHYESDAWVDVTTSNDTINYVICGQTISLSPFVVAELDTGPVDVVLRLADQYNVEIPGSIIQVVDLGLSVPTGTSVELPAGTHTFRLIPGIFGMPSEGNLHRDETREVAASTTGLDFEWITGAVQLRLHDQVDADIPGSLIQFYGYDVNFPTGDTVIVPITDNGIYPMLGGNLQDGYDFRLIPGIFGLPSGGNLRRDETREVMASTTGLAFEWVTSQVQLRLHDQHNADIPGSRLKFYEYGVEFPTGGTATLPVTDESLYPTLAGNLQDGYGLRLIPGVLNLPSEGNLHRDESREVTASTTNLDFEWITVQVQLRLRDQMGTDILGSRIKFYEYGIGFPTGDTVTLPVTDESLYPTLDGNLQDGYGLRLIPGIFGAPSEGNLHRDETREVTVSTSNLAFEWVTTPVQLRLHDQYDAVIVGSRIQFYGYGVDFPTGGMATVPVTDESLYPTLAGNLQNGYDFRLIPGIYGVPSEGNLHRDETREAGTSTSALAFEWIQVECPIQVQDTNGVSVPGSALALPPPFPSVMPGDSVLFLVSENAIYPTVSGNYADGYPITVTPGDIAPTSRTLEFEMLASGDLEPADFTIGPNTYSLACITNLQPSADAGGPYGVSEGGSVVVTATGNDPEGGPLTFAWDLDNNGTFEKHGHTVTFSAVGLDGPSARTIGVQTTDSGGLTATDHATISVFNASPTVDAITAPIEPLQVGSSVNTSATFSDPGALDMHAAVWDWGDDNTSPGTVTETGGSGTVAGSHTYTTPGVYTVRVIVTDDDGDSGESTFQFVVVYDPNGGFVTGGGWVNSPLGAYTANPSLTGRANFGFVSKYQKGASVPTGQTQFQFKIAALNFHSTSYDWLVVTGPHAKYKGSGTINGGGNYGFMLTATDGQVNGGGGIDKFRIKIWDKVTGQIIYDNQMGDADDANASDAIEGGSIVIHK